MSFPCACVCMCLCLALFFVCLFVWFVFSYNISPTPKRPATKPVLPTEQHCTKIFLDRNIRKATHRKDISLWKHALMGKMTDDDGSGDAVD